MRCPTNPLWDDVAWQGPHPGYVGGMLEAQPVLLREPNLVAFVTKVRCYPRGFLFEVVLEQAIDDGTFGHSGPSGAEPDHVVQVSVEFSDGSQWQVDADRVDGCLVALAHSGSAGDGGASWSTEFWLPALPLKGPVTFLVEVSGRKGRGTIDGEAIRTAAAKAVDLWS